MAARFWVGGNGTWDNTSTANWSATTGGAPGASAPTNVDTVTFDTNSGGGGSVVTVAATAVSLSTTINVANFTLSLSGSPTLCTPAGTLTITRGNIVLNNFTLSTGIFASSSANAKSISFGTGNIALTSATAGTTVLSVATATNFTWTGTGGFTRNMAATATVVFGTSGGTVSNAPNLTVNAGSSALTITTNSYFKNVNFTGNSSTVSASYNACGDLTLATGGTYTSINPSFIASGTFTSVGKTISDISINGAGITVTLADAMTVNSGGTFSLTQGTINLAGFTLTTGFFSSSNANTRSIAFGSTGKIQLTAATTSTIWNTSTVTNFTYTGTSNVEVAGSGSNLTKTVNIGAMSASQALNWTINENSGATANTVTFTANSAVNNLTVNTTNGGKYRLANTALTIYGNYSYGGSFTPGYSSVLFNGSTDTIRNLLIPSQVLNFSTGDFTIEAWIYKTTSQQGNILSLVNVQSGSNAGLSFQTSAANTFTQNNGVTATVNSGTFSLNTWTHIAAVRTSGSTQLYLNGVASGAPFAQAPFASQYFAIGCTITTTLIFFPGYISNVRAVKGVAVYTGNFTPPSLAPLATSGAASAASYPSTTNVNTSFPASATSVLACQTAMDMVENSIYKFPMGVIGTPSANFLNPYNSNIFPLVNSGANAWTFASTGVRNFSFNGLTHDMPVTFNGSGGTFVPQTSSSVGITRTTTLTNGTLDLNGYTFTTGSFATGAGTKNITFDGGTIVVSGPGATAFNNANPTGFTTSVGTSDGVIRLTNTQEAKTFVGGGSTFNCAIDQGGASALTISGSNTFLDITNSYKATGATTITFTAGTTTTVTNFTAAGEAGRILTINSSLAGSAATLSDASGLISVDYMSIRDSTATGGASWYAGANSTNVSNNLGWIFAAPGAVPSNMLLMFF